MKTRGILIAAFVSVVVISGCSKDPEVAKREYVRSGDQYVAEKKHKEALIEYRNAVQQDPRFGEARLKLAQTYEALGDGRSAFGEFIRAADLLPQDVETQVKAARLLLLARQYEDAGSRADKALAVAPKNVDALIVKGNAAAGLKNLDEALNQIDEAIKLEPGRSDSYANLGAIELARGNRPEAEAAFKMAAEADPKSVEARLALANFYWATGQPEKVEAILGEALALDANNGTTNRALAILFAATGRRDQAETHLKKLVEVSKDPKDHLLLADYYLVLNRRPDATKVLEALATNQPESAPTAKIKLATLAIAGDDRPQAHKLVDEALVIDPRNVDGLSAKARLLLDDNKPDEALARAQEAAKIDPRSLNAHFALGKIQSARREFPEAIAAYVEILKLSPQMHAARLELVRLHLANRNPDQAIQYAQEGLKAQPDNGQLTLLLNRAMLMKGDVAGAENRTRQLATAFPKSSSAQTQLGQMLAIKGDTAGARRAFEQALALNQNELEAVTGLTTLDFRAKNPAAARARIDARVNSGTKDPQLLLIAARVYAGSGDVAAAERALRRAIELDPKGIDAYAMLGQLYGAQRRLDEARTEFEQIAKVQPSFAVGARTLVGIILELQGKQAEARTTYEQVLALDSRAPVAANNLAWMLAEGGGNLDVALQLAQTAKSQLTDSAEVNDTLGWIYYKKGLAALAIPPLRDSVEKSPKNAMYQFHLGLAHVKNGDTAEGRKALEAALALDPKFKGADEAKSTLESLKS